jgi:hypothetical protein
MRRGSLQLAEGVSRVFVAEERRILLRQSALRAAFEVAIAIAS